MIDRLRGSHIFVGSLCCTISSVPYATKVRDNTVLPTNEKKDDDNSSEANRDGGDPV